MFTNDKDNIPEWKELDLAKQYFPILYFDSEERCYPTNMKYHLDNSDLYLSKVGFDDLIKTHELTVNDIKNCKNDKYYMDNIRGEIEDNSNIITYYENNRSNYGNITYVHVTKDTYKGVTYTAIQYWFFYAFNDGPVNNHEGDWEMVQILLLESGSPAFVVCAQHNSKEVLSWHDEKVHKFGDHVQIYVAEGSHASYFEPVLEREPLDWDLARGNGEFLMKENMDKIELLGERKYHPSSKNWLDYAGCWGDWARRFWMKGPPGPMFRYDSKCWNKPAQWALKDYKGVYLTCPANLSITDNQSRKIGFFNNDFIDEIPGATADIFGDVEIYYLPDNLTYLYEVHGYDNGTYNLTIEYEKENITVLAVDIPILLNATHHYSINWSALSQGEEGVNLQIDSDGDGTFEQTITSDSELTHDEFMLQTATIVDIDPDTLNLNSSGKWITCYIELPDGCHVEDINISTILLNDVIPAEDHPTDIGDYDNDGIPDLMVKFDRQAVQDILEPGDGVEIKITGELNDGTKFEGLDYIRVI